MNHLFIFWLNVGLLTKAGHVQTFSSRFINGAKRRKKSLMVIKSLMALVVELYLSFSAD